MVDKRIACDCNCNNPKSERRCQWDCGHLGCGWTLESAEKKEQEQRYIDSGGTRSHKAPDNLNAPGKASLKSSRKIKLPTDDLKLGKETITLEEYKRRENRGQS